MRIARLFAVCLLSLGVAMQGYASVRVMDESCPMRHVQATQEAATAHADHGMDAGHDMADMDHHQSQDAQESGHTDAPSAEHGATHCSGHLGCHMPGSALLPVQLIPVLRQFAQQAPPAATPAFHSHTSLLLWRPPAPL
jgi:hypothetical protein